MSDKIRREVHGFMHDGTRVFLGRVDATDLDVAQMLSSISDVYSGESRNGWFNVGRSVFNSGAFAGVQVTP